MGTNGTERSELTMPFFDWKIEHSAYNKLLARRQDPLFCVIIIILASLAKAH